MRADVDQINLHVFYNGAMIRLSGVHGIQHADDLLMLQVPGERPYELNPH